MGLVLELGGGADGWPTLGARIASRPLPPFAPSARAVARPPDAPAAPGECPARARARGSAGVTPLVARRRAAPRPQQQRDGVRRAPGPPGGAPCGRARRLRPPPPPPPPPLRSASASAALVNDELEQPRRRRLDARQVHDAQRSAPLPSGRWLSTATAAAPRPRRRGRARLRVNGRDGRRGGLRRERVGACAHQQRDDRDGGGGLLLSCERVAMRLGEGVRRSGGSRRRAAEALGTP